MSAFEQSDSLTDIVNLGNEQIDDLDLTVVLVTSPFTSMPSLSIIDYVIQSFALIEGLEQCPVKIVMDGYKVTDEIRTKKGRITSEAEVLYQQYYEALQDKYRSPQYEIIRCTQHLGFAHAVKIGLEACTTTYGLIAQHDRYFCHAFHRLKDLLDMMATHEDIRYIGFPTAANITHDYLLHFNYKVGCLNQSDMKYNLGQNLYLQPCIFWFDSQHLCHVNRYLNIYKPYKTFSRELFDMVGLKHIKDMFLRPGDFIEDRFGQIQRNLFIQFVEENRSEDVIRQLFRWYGSYLCWDSSNEHPHDVSLDSHKTKTKMMVSHLNGRGLDVQHMESLASQLGRDKIKSKRFLMLFPSHQDSEENSKGEGREESEERGDVINK